MHAPSLAIIVALMVASHASAGAIGSQSLNSLLELNLLAKRQDTSLDPNSIPSACQSTCASTVTFLNTCVAESCFCTNTNGAAFAACIGCIVQLNPLPVIEAQGQALLDEFTVDCTAAGLPVSSLVLPTATAGASGAGAVSSAASASSVGTATVTRTVGSASAGTAASPSVFFSSSGATAAPAASSPSAASGSADAASTSAITITRSATTALSDVASSSSTAAAATSAGTTGAGAVSSAISGTRVSGRWLVVFGIVAAMFHLF